MQYVTFGTSGTTPSYAFVPNEDVLLRYIAASASGQAGTDQYQAENFANGSDVVVDGTFILVSSGGSGQTLELPIRKGQPLFFYGFGTSYTLGFDSAQISAEIPT